MLKHWGVFKTRLDVAPRTLLGKLSSTYTLARGKDEHCWAELPVLLIMLCCQAASEARVKVRVRECKCIERFWISVVPLSPQSAGRPVHALEADGLLPGGVPDGAPGGGDHRQHLHEAQREEHREFPPRAGARLPRRS